MSSTENAVTLKLKSLDKEVTSLEKKLPFFRRWFRRVFSGKSFVAGQLVYEPYGMAKGFVIGCAAAGKNALPILAAGAAWVWEHVVTFFEGALAAFAASH